jgi:hypothetical protein
MTPIVAHSIRKFHMPQQGYGSILALGWFDGLTGIRISFMGKKGETG